MMTLDLNIKRLLATTMILLSAFALPYTAQAEGTLSTTNAKISETLDKTRESLEKSSCSKECSQVWSKVSKGGCLVDSTGVVLKNGNTAIVGSASNKLDITCLQEASKNSCFDSSPIDGGTGNYNTIGTRNNGTRNHYGTDIGASNTTSAKAYTVAEGTVVEYALSSGGGNTMVINHEIKCKGGLGAHSGYHSVYRHFFKNLVGVGTTVKPRSEGGQAIGIVGGSNYACGKFCQNPAQQNTGCGSASIGGCGYYAIHLHLEIQAGLYSAGSGTQARTDRTLQPYCQNIGVLCGGCPMPKKCGLRSGGPIPYGDASSIQNPGDGGAAAGSASGGADSEYDKQCNLSEFLNSEDCLFCGLFRTIFNVASVCAKTAMDALSGPSKKIVGIGFLIWILVYLFKHVATPAGTSTGEMLKGILFQGFRVAVVVIILTNALHSTMDLTLNPVLQTGLSFAQSLDEFSKCPADADYMKDVKGYDPSKGSGDSGASGGLSTDVGKAFVCSVKNMEDNVGVLMGIGKYLLCVSWHEEAWPGDLKIINARLIPHLGYFFNGLAYYLVGLMLVLCAPWCLIDCVLQLCVAAALIPCAIAAFAFKSTEKYLKIIWNFFMNAMFNFVFMAIILYIINSYMKSWMGFSELNDDIDKTMFIDPDRMAIYSLGNMGGAGLVIAAATGSKFRLASIGGIVVLGICFLCWSFFDEAKEMAERFANSPSLGGRKGIGKLVGGTLASAGTAVAKPVIKLGSEGVMAVTDKAGSALNSAVGNKWRSGMNHFRGKAGFVTGRLFNRFGGSSHEILNDDGEMIGYESSINILGRRINQKVQKDDSGMWVRETDSHDSNGAEDAFEKKFDARGNVEKINLKDLRGNNIKDENGNDVMVDAYSSNHRILGFTHGREDMDAFLVNGDVVYRTAGGTREFTMNKDGEITEYKTRFTTNGQAEKVVKRGGIRTVDDGFMKSSTLYNREGETVKDKTRFANESAKYLVNNDGSINTYAMAQMQNGAADRDKADTEIINMVMQARGQGLSNTFSSRRVTRGNDGSFVIEQTDRNDKNKKTIVTAKMVDNVMVIDTKIFETITDKDGTKRQHIMHTVSNGMQFKTETFTQNDKGSYDYNARFGFANHIHAGSNTPPIDKDGKWRGDIDRDKAMAGFTDADFQKHVQGLSGEGQDNISAAQMQRQLNANAADAGVASAVEYEMLCQKGASEEQPLVINLTDGGQELHYVNSQGLLVKNTYDKQGNMTRTMQYNQAERVGKAKTFTPKPNAEEPRGGGDNPNPNEPRGGETTNPNTGETRDIENKAETTEPDKSGTENRKAEEDKKEENKKDNEEKKDKKQKQEKDKERYSQLNKEKSGLEETQDYISQQYTELRDRLVAAQEALQMPDLSPEQQKQYQKEYGELYAQTVKMAEKLNAMRQEANEKARDYNNRVEKHNSGLEEHFKKQ